MNKKNDSQAPIDLPEENGTGEIEIIEPELPSELAALTKERDEWKNKALYTAAEYENYRRRTAQERERLWGDAQADTLTKTLPIYDNLLRAAAQPTEDAAYAKGVELILQQWNDLFVKQNITPVGAVGEPFDPKLHEAVAHTQEEGLPPNSIAEVFAQGFASGDRILRHAIVRVVN